MVEKFDYARMRETALRLLTKFGKEVTLMRSGKNDSNYNPSDGTFSGAVPTEPAGVGVLLAYNNKEINGTEIRATDRKLIFQGDKLLIGDLYGDFRVHAVNDIDPDETGIILTIVQLRGS